MCPSFRIHCTTEQYVSFSSYCIIPAGYFLSFLCLFLLLPRCLFFLLSYSSCSFPASFSSVPFSCFLPVSFFLAHSLPSSFFCFFLLLRPCLFISSCTLPASFLFLQCLFLSLPESLTISFVCLFFLCYLPLH